MVTVVSISYDIRHGLKGALSLQVKTISLTLNFLQENTVSVVKQSVDVHLMLVALTEVF